MNLRDVKIPIGLIFTGVSVGSAALYIYSLHQLKKNAQVQMGARVHKVDASGVELVIEGRIINPTSGSVRLKQPIIYLYSSQQALDRNTPFATSPTSDRTFTVPPNETKVIEPISITISIEQILQLLGQGITKGELDLHIAVRSQVYGRYFLSFPIKEIIHQKITVPNVFRREGAPDISQNVVADNMFNILHLN